VFLVKKTKQKKYLDELEQKGKVKVLVVSTIKRKHEIIELAAKHRAELAADVVGAVTWYRQEVDSE
jgi:hypothetical protein